MKSQLELPPHETAGEDVFQEFLSQQIDWFKGVQNPEALVYNFLDAEITRREEEARSLGELGPGETNDRVRNELVAAVSAYLSLIIRISEYACDAAARDFREDEAKVVLVRADLDLHTWLVKVLFIIDASTNLEMSFYQLLNQIEMDTLREEPFVAELRYINRRGTEIDFESIRREYPFVGSVSMKD